MSTAVEPSETLPAKKSLGLAKTSSYEQVASLLLAMLTVAGVLVFCLFCIWLALRVVIPKAAPAQLRYIEDIGGGVETGVLNETMFVEGPLREEIAVETDLQQEPTLDEVMPMITDAVAVLQAQLDDPLLSEDVPTGEQGGSEGTGNALPLGLGPGNKGGVRREDRWVIRFEDGGTLEAYGRQLDYFSIELGAIGGERRTVEYAVNLGTTPTSRTGSADQEKRLFFSWQQGELQQADRELLGRAGVNTNGKIVVQFYPEQTEQLLANIEADFLAERYPGKDIRQVRRTRFGVRSEGNDYAFFVIDFTFF